MQQSINTSVPKEQDRGSTAEVTSKEREEAEDTEKQKNIVDQMAVSAPTHPGITTTTTDDLPKKPASFSSSLLLDIPPELLLKIILELYIPGTKFPKATSLLRVSKDIHTVAHPIFLQNYLFTCSPFLPSKPGTDDKEGDIGDLDRIYSKIEEEDDFGLHEDSDWMAGLKMGFEALFEKRGPEHEGNCLGAFERWEPQTRHEHKMVAKRFVEHAIRHNPSIRKLSSMGSTHVAKIQHLRIVWGYDEEDLDGHWGDEGFYCLWESVGFRVIGIMSVLCPQWMPNLKSVQMVPIIDYPTGCEVAATAADYNMLSPKEAKEMFVEELGGEWNEIPGAPEDIITVLALQQFLNKCPNLIKLRLDFYSATKGAVAWPEWWQEVLRKDGLILQIHQKWLIVMVHMT